MTRRNRARGAQKPKDNSTHANATSCNAVPHVADHRHIDPQPISASCVNPADATVVPAHAHDSASTGGKPLVTTPAAPKDCFSSRSRQGCRQRDRHHAKETTTVHEPANADDAVQSAVCATSSNVLHAIQNTKITGSKDTARAISAADGKGETNYANKSSTTPANATGDNSDRNTKSNVNNSVNADDRRTASKCAHPVWNNRRRGGHRGGRASTEVYTQPPHMAGNAAYTMSNIASGHGTMTRYGNATHTPTTAHAHCPLFNSIYNNTNNNNNSNCYSSNNNNNSKTNNKSDTDYCNSGMCNSSYAQARRAKYGPHAPAPVSPPVPHDVEHTATPPLVTNTDNYANWSTKDFMAIIKAFVMGSDSTELVFPASLTSAQRSTVHRLASSFKLTHKSYGSGAQRALKLTKDGSRFSNARNKHASERDEANSHVDDAPQPFVKTYSGFQGAQSLMTPYLTHHIVATTMSKLLPLKKSILRHLRSEVTHMRSRRLRLAQPPLAQVPVASAEVISRHPDLQKFRQTLPAYRARGAVVSAVQSSAVVIVSGATGRGKTTQIPQILYDTGIFDPEMSIVCTQPRRISALSIAQRVAEERGEACGNRSGYIIRFENVTSRQTRIVYVTTGILLRRLHTDPTLTGIACVVVDEVHERDMETDFCLLLLRDRLRAQRRNPRAFATLLKVVVMSATVQIEPLLRYFADCGGAVDVVHDTTHGTNNNNSSTASADDNTSRPASAHRCSDTSSVSEHGQRGKAQSSAVDATYAHGEPPLITIEGTLFPVEEYFLEEALAVTGTAASSVAAARLKALQVNPHTTDNGSSIARNDSADLPSAGAEGASATLFDKLKTSVADSVDPSADATIPYELIVRLITHIHQSNMRDLSGSILVFLPGWSAIQGVSDRLRRTPVATQLAVFTLHSSLTSTEQQRVFFPPPRRYRKVVLSTNLAETSVTINDIVYVIDSGLYKGNRYDANTNTSSLQATMIARANGQQRRGRAGRCRAGVCYHLLPRAVYAALPDFLPPAMMSSALEEVCLQIKAVHPGERCAAVLQRALDAPPAASVQHAVRFLTDMGALGETDEGLTHLGRALAQLPTHPQLGKMLFAAACLGVLSPIATIAAALSIRSIFVKPQPFERAAARETARRVDDGDLSDHLCTLKVYDGWVRSGRSAGFAMQHGADATRLRALDKTRGQLERLVCSSALMRRMGEPRWRVSCMAGGGHTALVRLVLLWSLYPRLATVDYRRCREVNKPQVVCWDDKHAVFSASSVLERYRRREFGDRSLVMYYERMYLEATLNLFDCTAVAPADVVLCVREMTVRPLAELPLDWVLDETSTLVPQLPFDTRLLYDEDKRRATGQDATGTEAQDECDEDEGVCESDGVLCRDARVHTASRWMAMILDKDRRMYVTDWQVAVLLSLARECMNYYLALCIQQLRVDAFPIPLIFLLCDVMGYPVASEEQERVIRRARDGPGEGEAVTGAATTGAVYSPNAEEEGGDYDDEELIDSAPAPDFVRGFVHRHGNPTDGAEDAEDAEDAEILMEEVKEAFTIELTPQERMQVRDALGDLMLFQSEGVGAAVAAAAASSAVAASPSPPVAQPLSSLAVEPETQRNSAVAPRESDAPGAPNVGSPVSCGSDAAVGMSACSSSDEDADEDIVVMEAGALNIAD